MTQKEMETVFYPSSLESIKKLKFSQNTEFLNHFLILCHHIFDYCAALVNQVQLFNLLG